MGSPSHAALSGPSDAGPEALLTQAWCLMYDDLARCTALAQDALAAARRTGESEAAGVALALVLNGAAQFDSPAAAAAQVAQARAEAQALGSQRGMWACDDLLALIDMRQGHTAAARQRLRQTDAVPAAARSLLERRYTLGLLLMLEFHANDHEAALPLAHRHLAMARSSGVATLEGIALQALAAIHLVVMDDETGLPMLEQACALMARSAAQDAREHGYANTVYAHYAAGRPADAARALQAWLDDCGPPDQASLAWDRHRVSFALGHLATQQLQAAEDLLGTAPPARWMQQAALAGWHWARGWLLLAQGRPQAAEDQCRAYLARVDSGALPAPRPLDAVQLQEVLRSAAEMRGDWQLALQATKALRSIELPMLRVHARVRFLSVQWQLRAQGHTADAQRTQHRLDVLERSIAAHERDWTFDIVPHTTPPPAPPASGYRQMAHLGHEIRTPLSGLMGLTDLLLQTPLDAQQMQLVSLARSTADALMRLLNDLLDMAKMEAGRFKLNPGTFSLAALVQESAALTAQLARLRQLDFQLWIDPRLPAALQGDRDRLRQVLGNLLSNALKFTRIGHIRLTVHCLDDQDPIALRLEVSDTGPGVAPTLRQRLFTEYAQAEDTAAGGTGLGLAISRQLIDAMGGRIGVDDRPGGGSIFWLELSLPRTAGHDALAHA